MPPLAALKAASLAVNPSPVRLSPTPGRYPANATDWPGLSPSKENAQAPLRSAREPKHGQLQENLLEDFVYHSEKKHRVCALNSQKYDDPTFRRGHHESKL